MTTNVASESVWAEGLAARLKLLQSDCADSAASTRQEYVAEEIARALKAVPGERRSAYLDALAERFPDWAPATADAGKPIGKELTAEELTDRLIDQARTMPEDAKLALARKLEAAGLAREVRTQEGWKIPEDLLKKLGVAAGDTLSAPDAFRLLSLLLPEWIKLDVLTWETWSKLAPRSGYRREAQADFRSSLERYLREGGAAAGPQMQPGLEKSRKLIAGLLAAIPMGGKDFAEEYMVRFLPKNIEDVAASRGGGLFGDSTEKRCWIKYKELAYSETESIEKKIRDAIAKQAEEMARRF